VDVVIAIACGIVAGVAVDQTATRLGIRDARSQLGSVLVGVIFSLAAGDLLIGGLGRWWGDRPMLSSGVSGLLLLGLTVLLIDKLIERSRAGQLRSIVGGRVAYLLWAITTGSLPSAQGAIEDATNELLASDSLPPAIYSDAIVADALKLLASAAAELAEATKSVAPHLMMSAEYTPKTYGAMTGLDDVARGAPPRIERQRKEQERYPLRTGTPGSLDRRNYVASVLGSTRDEYNALVAAARKFEGAAHMEYKAELVKEGMNISAAFDELDPIDA
jgi:hypothetical protein